MRGSGGSTFWRADAGTDSGNNLDGIVLFVDRVQQTSASNLDGDYHLAYGTKVIDAGTNSGVSVVYDLDGHDLVFSNRVDMGCY